MCPARWKEGKEKIGELFQEVRPVLDRSESMAGDPIQLMNDATRALGKFMDSHRELMAQIDVSVISFSTEVRTEVTFQQNNTLRFAELIPEGDSSLNQALLTAMDALECRKKEYKNEGLRYYRPALFVITDGNATDTAFRQEAVFRLQQAIQLQKINYVPIAVGNVDENYLKEYYLEDRSEKLVFCLRDTLLSEFFSWFAPFTGRFPAPADGSETVVTPPGIYLSV